MAPMPPRQALLVAAPSLPKHWAVVSMVLPTPTPGRAQATPAATGQAYRILVVDDEPEMLLMTKLFIEQAFPGAGVDTAATGMQALDMVAATNYDAIVSDYRMPTMDGLAFLEQAGAHVPPGRRILMTAFADRALRQRADQAGFAFLEKAGDPQNVVEALRRALSR